MGAAVSTVYYNLKLRHPTIDMPFIDYDLVLLIQPLLMLGISIRVAFNVIFDDWMVTILLIILFLVISTKAFLRGVDSWKGETMLRKEAAKHQEHNDLTSLRIARKWRWWSLLQSIYSTFPSPEKIPVIVEDEVAQQSIHKVSSISESPQHSTGTEVPEVNIEAPIHLSTILEDVELTAEVQNPVDIEESNDGEEANISNAIIDPEDDLFFPKDMPMHVRLQKMKELDAKKGKDYFDNLWNAHWKDDTYTISRTKVVMHLEITEQKIKNPDMLNHLKASNLVVRSLHTTQEATTSQINQIKESLTASRLTTHQEIQKQIAPIVFRQTAIEAIQARLEAKQAQMSTQLIEVQNSMELILSLLLGDDLKKGEKIIKSKCKQLTLTDTDDENPDGGTEG
ncbi:hypothetical protein AgCh_027814 [Apium graveolens]